MAESEGLGDDQAEDESKYVDEEEEDDDDDEGEDEGPAVHACAQPEPATCHGRTEFLMNAIKHLSISRPLETDLREQADTLLAWLKSVQEPDARSVQKTEACNA
jgi:hypothetical protein